MERTILEIYIGSLLFISHYAPFNHMMLNFIPASHPEVTHPSTRSVRPSRPLSHLFPPLDLALFFCLYCQLKKKKSPPFLSVRVCAGVLVPSAGTPLPPGTPTIPLSQLQQHSLALQGQHGQALAAAPQPQQGQQAVFRFPAAVSLTGDPNPMPLLPPRLHASATPPASLSSPALAC